MATEEVRLCAKCGTTLSLSNTSLSRLTRGENICRKCQNQQAYNWRHRNPEKQKAYGRKRYLKYREKYRKQKKESARLLKTEVLGHYGGMCVCCGETCLDFLTIEHIGGGGDKHRIGLFGTNTGGSIFYRWIKRNGYPKNLTVLCWNCNCGARLNKGVCPHQTIIKQILGLTAQMKVAHT